MLLRALLSWVVRDYRHPLMKLLLALTEPLMGPIRKLLDRLGLGGTMMDFSAMAAIMFLALVSSLVALW